MNQVYPKGMQALLEAYFLMTGPDSAADLFVVGVDSDYVYSPVHTEVEDLGLNVLTDPVTLTGVTLTDGVVKADDLTPGFTSLAPATTIDALVIFAAGAWGSNLLAYLDETQNLSLPVLIGSADLNITWDAAGIFKI